LVVKYAPDERPQATGEPDDRSLKTHKEPKVPLGKVGAGVHGLKRA